jgi:transcriptional regulator with XRE-family HTH domain
MLADNVEKRIQRLGWSIETTAKRTNLHRNVISKIIHGGIRDPRMSTLMKLAYGLDINLDTLLGQPYEYVDSKGKTAR